MKKWLQKRSHQMHRSLRLHRLRRLAASGSPILLAGVATLAGLASSKFSDPEEFSFLVLLAVLAALIALLGFQIKAEYRRRTYDPKLMLELDKDFYSPEMQGERVLDFFDSIGFFMQGDEITPEVAHHTYYYWIDGYYRATCRYIEVIREKRPPQWEHIEYLHNMTHQVEFECIRRIGKKAEETKLIEFLKEEIQLKADRGD